MNNPLSKGTSVLEEFKVAVRELQNVFDKNPSMVFRDTDSVVLEILYIIEKALKIGLKDLSLFSMTTIWDYQQKISECIPTGKDLVKYICKFSKSPFARSRIFIRHGLNEKSLDDYISALIWNQKISAGHYQDYSVIRNENLSNVFIALIQTLKLYNFNLDLSDKSLEMMEFWDNYLKEKKIEADRIKRQAQQSLLLSPSSALNSSPLSSSPQSSSSPSPSSTPHLSSPLISSSSSSLLSTQPTTPSTPTSTSTPQKKHKRQRTPKIQLSQIEFSDVEVEKLRNELQVAQQQNVELRIDLEKSQLEKRNLSLRANDYKAQTENVRFELEIYKKRFRKMRPDATLPSLSSINLPSFGAMMEEVARDADRMSGEGEEEYLPADVVELLTHSQKTFEMFDSSNRKIDELLMNAKEKLNEVKNRDLRSLNLLLQIQSTLEIGDLSSIHSSVTTPVVNAPLPHVVSDDGKDTNTLTISEDDNNNNEKFDPNFINDNGNGVDNGECVDDGDCNDVTMTAVGINDLPGREEQTEITKSEENDNNKNSADDDNITVSKEF